MGRARAALLEGALRAVEKYGVRRTTMADVASVAGIAKGTVYNHFRTKNDVLTAAACAAIDELGAACAAIAAADGVTSALAHAAETITRHPALRRATEEPAALAALVRVGDGVAWQHARLAIARMLEAGGHAMVVGDAPSGGEADAATEASGAVAAVLRWLVGYAVAQADPADIPPSAAALAGGVGQAG